MAKVKICGLSTKETVLTAVKAGAKYIGLVFYPPSPRNVTINQAAEILATPYQDILTTFASLIIMLFWGGFFLAMAATKYHLDVNLARVFLRPSGGNLQNLSCLG